MSVVAGGIVARGYEGVASAFAAAFAGRPRMGAALSVRVAGEPVVSLWGGLADARTGLAWAADTPSVIFSCTKGLMAILAARLVSAGRLDYDAPVARYWPEFAAAGKGEVTVGEALAHRAGLSAPDADLELEDILDWDRVTAHLAQQAPIWPRGTGYAYHALTHGWLAGEILRRVTGKPVGALFREELALPLHAEAWIGVPDAVLPRVAHLEVAPALAGNWDAAAAADTLATPNWLFRAMTLGRAFPPALVTGDGGFNDPRVRMAAIPGAGGIATADALAAIWSATVTPTAGVRLLSPRIVARATATASEGPPVFAVPGPYARWGMGFQLDSEARRFLTGESFGHDGAGGQSAFADPVHNVGFAFLTNWMEGAGDDRATTIIVALRAALKLRRKDIDFRPVASAKSI